MLKNKHIMVTGGAGFIGSHVVDAIIKESPEKIIAVSNFFLGKMDNLDDAKKNFPSIEIIKQDVCDYEGMKRIFEKHDIDIVFNLAVIPLPVSLEKPEWCVQQNVDMTLNVCKLLREDKFKTLVQYSSSEAYGSAVNVSMGEDHPLNPETPYAASKAATDLIALSYYRTFGSDVTVVRPFNNYGPRQNAGKFAGIIPLMINKMLNDEEVTIFGDGEQTRDFIYVTDTADATIDIYNNKSTRGKVINLGSGEEVTINEIVRLMADLTGYKRESVYKEARPGDVRRHCSDISLAKKLINFKCKVGIKEGLKNTVEFYKGLK